MSDTQNTQTVNPLSTPQTVERNGLVATLKLCVGKRDTWKDRPYQVFQLETDGTDSKASEDAVLRSGLNWIGKENVKNSLNTIFRRFGQDFVEDATGDEDTEKAGGLKAGIFSMEKFLSFWTNLKSSAMRLSELNEAYQTAVTEFQRFTAGYTENGVQVDGELMQAIASADPVRIAKAKEIMISINNTLLSLKNDLEERKARRSKEAATETASPA